MESKRKLIKTMMSLRKIFVFLVILTIALPVTGTVSAATPPSLVITTTTSNVTLPSSGTVTLSANVTFTGGTAPTGWIETTLTTPSGVLTTPLYVTGNKSFTVSTTLPTAGLIAGTYTWAANYTDDINSDNNTASNQGQTLVSAAVTTLAVSADPTSVAIGSSLQVLKASASLSAGYYPTGTITFSLNAPGGATVDTETVTVTGNGTYTTPTGFTLPTTGTVTGSYQWDVSYSGNSNNDSSHSNGSVTVTPQQAADLSITNTVSNATPNVGDTVTFSVTLTNNGPDSATGVVVTDLLPAGLTFVSATPSQGSYTSTTGAWTVGTVPLASPVSLMLQARVVSPNAQTNTATISHADQSDPDTSNNASSATATPQQADLSVVNTVSNATPNIGDTIAFTVTVSNNGPDSATNVVVTNLLPAGLTLVSATPSQGTSSPASGAWTVGTVAISSQVSLMLQATVVSTNAQTNTATISRADQYDPNTINNTASASVTPVTPQAPTYTVTFDSRGGSSVSNISGVASGSTISTPATPTLSGYTFVGWYKESSYTNAWNFSIDTVTGNLTLFGKWMYNGGGGSGNSNSNSSGNGSSNSSSSTINPPITSAYNADISGIGLSGTTLSIITNTDAASAAVDLEALAEYILNNEKTITITIPAIPGVNAYTLGIPVDYLSTPDRKGTLLFNTKTGSITLPAGMLANIRGSERQKAEITISQGDKSGMPDNIKTAIGDRPLIQLAVSIDGKQIEWNNPNAPVMISIPYTPTAAELANPESIMIWYIDGDGKVVSVPNGQYDPVTGTVTFSTPHFSNYAVSYNQVSFKDVEAGTWFAKAVSFIAAREITTGTSSGIYSPDAKLIRGDFLVMLMKSYGIAADADPKDTFSDAGNTYYTGYLAAAKRLGVSTGVGSNMFAPEKEITRQEMFTLLYNALKVIGKLPQSHSGKTLSDFTDAGLIDSWAKEAMTLLVETGSIGGNAGKLTPTSTTTRAEMAQVLYNLLAK